MATREIYGIPCTVTGSGNAFDRDIDASTHLYYLIHEAVNNAVKTGRARRSTADQRYGPPPAVIA